MKMNVTIRHLDVATRRMLYEDFIVDALDGDDAYRLAQIAAREKGLVQTSGVHIEPIVVIADPVAEPVPVVKPKKAATRKGKTTKVRAANPILAAIDDEHDGTRDVGVVIRGVGATTDVGLGGSSDGADR